MELFKRVSAAKQNKYEMNNFITEYKPFIAGIVQKQVGRFVQYGKDDELSIGMMAFEEAVRAYNSDKGPFLSFAEQVIQRRIIDFLRKESRHNNTLPFSSFYNQEEDKQIDVTENEAILAHNQKEESENRGYEIVEIQSELKGLGISFFELPEVSPKHQETKKLYKEIIDTIVKNHELVDFIKVKRYFPVAEVEKITGIHRKTIERSRKYVLAMVVILTGPYKYVQSFLNWR